MFGYGAQDKHFVGSAWPER